METVVSVFVAFFLGGILVVGASLTGQQEKLCSAMGGVYTPAPQGGDVCPGGKWSALLGVRPTPQQ